MGQRTHILEKRYRDILSLHKEIKKQIRTPKFPPKQIRNHDIKVRKVYINHF